MIFDRLVNTDGQSRMVPGLATEWRAVEPNVWEFKLRPGVRFHNGQEFTAEDVAFTFARVPNVPNSPSSFADLHPADPRGADRRSADHPLPHATVPIR